MQPATNLLTQILNETNDEIMDVQTPFPEFLIIMTKKARWFNVFFLDGESAMIQERRIDQEWAEDKYKARMAELQGKMQKAQALKRAAQSAANDGGLIVPPQGLAVPPGH